MSYIFFKGFWIAEQKTDFALLKRDLTVSKSTVQLNDSLHATRLVAMGSTDDDDMGTWISRRDLHAKRSRAGGVPSEIL